MNVLLLEPSEIENETVRLDGRRAEHCLKVLKVRPGSRVRAAVLENGAVEAEISTVGVDSLGLRLGQIQPAPKPQLHIALAIPRPKALSRIIQATSSFGVASITLFNAWKVEKSYLTSPRLAPSRLAQDALLGCEQGRQCHLPELRVEMRFVEFLNRQAVPPPNEASYVLDPTAEQRLNVPLATASDRSPPPPMSTCIRSRGRVHRTRNRKFFRTWVGTRAPGSGPAADGGRHCRGAGRDHE